MKKLTCSAMGGPCDAEVSGNSLEELVANGTKHLQEAHPDMASSMMDMPEEQKSAWMAGLKEKWEQAPDSEL